MHFTQTEALLEHLRETASGNSPKSPGKEGKKRKKKSKVKRKTITKGHDQPTVPPCVEPLRGQSFRKRSILRQLRISLQFSVKKLVFAFLLFSLWFFCVFSLDFYTFSFHSFSVKIFAEN